jgi:cell pole-organizing protein PopZ
MTDTNQEPTMEEILASIRRIISEDEAPAADEAATPPAPVEAAAEPEAEPEAGAEPAPEPAAEAPLSLSDLAPPEPPAEPDTSDEVLDLTDRVETVPAAPAAPPIESVGDLDVYTPSRPIPEPAFGAPASAQGDGLVSTHAAGRAASAFDQLASSLIMPKDGRTLEDVVQELLRPLLKAWLDENLPGIVQRAVEAEVERIARGRVR